MRADRGVQVRVRQAGEQGMGTKRGWVVAVGLALGLAGWLAGAKVAAEAAPLRQGVVAPVCRWQRRTDTMPDDPTILLPLEGHGYITVLGQMAGGGNFVSTGAALLDLSLKPEGAWRMYDMRPWKRWVAPAEWVIARSIAPDIHEIVGLSVLSKDVTATQPAQVERLRVSGTTVTLCDTIQPRTRLVLDGSQQGMVVYNSTDGSLVAIGILNRPTVIARIMLSGSAPDWETKPLWPGGRIGLIDPRGSPLGSRLWYDSNANRIVVGTETRSGANLRLHFLDLDGGWNPATWSEWTPSGMKPDCVGSVLGSGLMIATNALTGCLSGKGTDGEMTVLDLSSTPPEWRTYPISGAPFAPDVRWEGSRTVHVGGEDVIDVFHWVGPTYTGVAWSLWCRSATGPAPMSAATSPLHATVQSTNGPSSTNVADLVVSRIVPRPAYQPSGIDRGLTPATLAPCVRNVGAAPAPRFTVRADDGVTWTAPGLGAGQELCLEPKASRGRTVTVDPDNRVREADETNNTRVVAGAPVPATGAR